MLLVILPEGDKHSKRFGLARLAGGLALPPGLPHSAGERDGLAKLRTAEVENTGTLLGENSSGLEVPEKAPPVTAGGENASAAMKITVPRLDFSDVAVPTGSKQAEPDREGVYTMCPAVRLPWIEGSNTFIMGHALRFRGPGALTSS